MKIEYRQYFLKSSIFGGFCFWSKLWLLDDNGPFNSFKRLLVLFWKLWVCNLIHLKKALTNFLVELF
eukprot:snap_masked-scaffold_7-processed-gene-10.41-mRNA-1 protein AED:1.00 eAED:1.00 QI:0/0/0/0/1/1/2/0/66